MRTTAEIKKEYGVNNNILAKVRDKIPKGEVSRKYYKGKYRWVYTEKGFRQLKGILVNKQVKALTFITEVQEKTKDIKSNSYNINKAMLDYLLNKGYTKSELKILFDRGDLTLRKMEKDNRNDIVFNTINEQVKKIGDTIWERISMLSK